MGVNEDATLSLEELQQNRRPKGTSHYQTRAAPDLALRQERDAKASFQSISPP